MSFVEDAAACLAAFLEQHGLSGLLDKCIELRFTVPALLALEEDDLPLLTTYPGERILLRKLIRDQRATPGASSATPGASSATPGASSATPGASSATPGASSATPGTSSVPSCSASGSQSSGETSHSCKRRTAGLLPTAAAKLQKINEFDAIAKQDLRLLLESDISGGKEIVAWFNAESEESDKIPVLGERQRDKVSEVVAKFLLALTPNPDHKLFPILTKKIVELFPSESEETYYIPPKTESLLQTHPKGKLPNSVRNLKSRRKLLGRSDSASKQQEPPVSRKAGSYVDVLKKPVTDEQRAAQKWLAHGNSPWPLVLQKWKLTAPLRFRAIFESSDPNFVMQYISQWPILNHKSANELLLEDFKLVHGRADSKLLDSWDVFIKKVLTVASKDVVDKNGRILVKQVEELMAIAQPRLQNRNNLAYTILQLLPYLRPNHTFVRDGKIVKTTIQEARDSFLLEVERETDIKEAIKTRRAAISSSSAPGGQPLLVIVGSPINRISVYVTVASLRFKLDGVVEALDLFFKIFHVLHLQYPVESQHIWTFLQRAVYGFSSEWDTDVQYSLIKACKC